jgi:hypothetical protein
MNMHDLMICTPDFAHWMFLARARRGRSSRCRGVLVQAPRR